MGIAGWTASSSSAPKMASEERRPNDSLATTIELVALCVSMIGKLGLARTVRITACRVGKVSSIRPWSLSDTFRYPGVFHGVAGWLRPKA